MTKFGLILTVIMSMTGGFYLWLHTHDQLIYNNATSVYNQQQDLVYQQKQQEFVNDTKTISDNADRIRAEIEKQKQADDAKLSAIEQKATSTNGANNPTSPYLKNIIDQLNLQYGSKK
jgi:hypothetical protein